MKTYKTVLIALAIFGTHSALAETVNDHYLQLLQYASQANTAAAQIDAFKKLKYTSALSSYQSANSQTTLRFIHVEGVGWVAPKDVLALLRSRETQNQEPLSIATQKVRSNQSRAGFTPAAYCNYLGGNVVTFDNARTVGYMAFVHNGVTQSPTSLPPNETCKFTDGSYAELNTLFSGPLGALLNEKKLKANELFE